MFSLSLSPFPLFLPLFFCAFQMERDLFGTATVAVVHDRLDCSQDRMHLDTVLNIVDERRVVALEDILGPESPKRRLVQRYSRDPMGGQYSKNGTEVELSVFLRQEGFQVIPATNAQQLAYFINFVNLGVPPQDLAMWANQRPVILGVHPELPAVLARHGFKGASSALTIFLPSVVECAGMSSVEGSGCGMRCFSVFFFSKMQGLSAIFKILPFSCSLPHNEISSAAAGLFSIW